MGETTNPVFPAQAGMNRKFRLFYGYISGVPRAGGDEPEPLRPITGYVQCSPRRRG